MASVYLFDEETNKPVLDACGGEPDGTTHKLELFIRDGHVHVHVDLSGNKRCVDLRLTKTQAIAFANAAKDSLLRLGLRK